MSADTVLMVIDAPALRRAQTCVTTEESRPILRGVYIETSGVMVATDGRVLLAQRFAASPCKRDALLTIPATLLKDKKAHSVHVTLPLTAPTSGEDAEVLVEVFSEKGLSLAKGFGQEITGPFPNWRQVMPAAGSQRVSAGIATLDAKYMARFASFQPKDVPVHMAMTAGAVDGSAVLVTFHAFPDAVAVVMPCHDKREAVRDIPAWATITRVPAMSEAAA